MSVAAPLVLRKGDRARLEALTRSTSVRAGLALRARIVLLAAAGLANAEIARRTGSTRPTVLAWRNRYAAGGIDALGDKPRSGRPTRVDEIEVVASTLADGGRPPTHLGASHWSARLLGNELGISFATVARIWRKWGIQPQRIETFRPSLRTDLQTTATELYRHPPERTVLQRRGTSGTGTEPQPAATPARHPDPWLNLVEVSLGILLHQAIRRGTFASVHNLIEAIGALTDGWNDQEDVSTHRTRPAAAIAPENRKDTSYTRLARTRSVRPIIDLQRSSRRAADRSADPLSLRAEFHGSQCRQSVIPDESEGLVQHPQDPAHPQTERRRRTTTPRPLTTDQDH